MWKNFKRDFKERFMKFETLRGIILMPSGIILILTTWTHLQYSIQVFMTSVGVYWFIDGLRKIFVNRVKQQVVLDEQVKYAAVAKEIK